MHLVLDTLGFPAWLIAEHWINVLLMGFMIRSGIQILGSYPRLYWNDHSQPGTEWIKFTKKQIPKDKIWITLDQEVEVPAWLGQPGGKQLGLGRHWHYFALLFWIGNGVIYVILLFTTGEWQRLIPTSWSIFPDAFHIFLTYITFHVPPASAFKPYDPLQQLAYAGVVFILAPVMILTGAAQSPAINAQFPWFVRLLGGKQSARSIHFLGLIAFLGFIIVHVSLVFIVNFGHNMDEMVLGQENSNEGLAVVLGLSIVAICIIIWGVTTRISQKQPRQMQRTLGAVIHPLMHALGTHVSPHQKLTYDDLTPNFLVNGALPTTDEYYIMQQSDFVDYRLDVGGLVQTPLRLSMADLYSMPQEEHVTRHYCIQGWTSIGAWKGVPFSALLDECQPLPEARYVVFWSFSDDTAGNQYYETLPIEVLRQPQTLLAYEMNGERLPVAHGAPVRLRVESQLGFKMVKWLQRIEFVEDYATIREGQGGSREDDKYYEAAASI